MPGVCMSEKRNKQDYTIFTKTIYIMRNWFSCGTTDVLEFKHLVVHRFHKEWRVFVHDSPQC